MSLWVYVGPPASSGFPPSDNEILSAINKLSAHVDFCGGPPAESGFPVVYNVRIGTNQLPSTLTHFHMPSHFVGHLRCIDQRRSAPRSLKTKTLAFGTVYTFLPETRIPMPEYFRRETLVPPLTANVCNSNHTRSRPEKSSREATPSFVRRSLAAMSPWLFPPIAEATLWKTARVLNLDVANCMHEMETRFLQTPVDTLAKWLDWSEDIRKSVRTEAKRLIEDVRLLRIGVRAEQRARRCASTEVRIGTRRPSASIIEATKPAAQPGGLQPAPPQPKSGCTDREDLGT